VPVCVCVCDTLFELGLNMNNELDQWKAYQRQRDKRWAWILAIIILIVLGRLICGLM